MSLTYLCSIADLLGICKGKILWKLPVFLGKQQKYLVLVEGKGKERRVLACAKERGVVY